MAVLDRVPGIEVKVRVDGKYATEYVDPHASKPGLDTDQDCPVVTKYIESIDNAYFVVELIVDRKLYAWNDIPHSLMAYLSIDGTLVSRRLLSSDKRNVKLEGERVYLEDSRRWCCRKFKFSAIQIVDDPHLVRMGKDTEVAKDLGLIKVSLERHVKDRRVSPKPSPPAKVDMLELAEKALKGNAISHSTSSGEIKMIREVVVWKSHRVAEDTGPIAVFRFMYRSRESLEKELIVPRTPLPEEQSVNNMTIDELRRLARERLDQIKWAEEAKNRDKSDTKRKVNEVVDVDDDDETDKARAAKRPAIFIDLTDD